MKKQNFWYKGYTVSKTEPNPKTKCGCPFPVEKFPIKHYVPVEMEDGSKGYILISDEEFKRIKEKIEIREVFK